MFRRERRDSRGALRRAGDDGPRLRLAEQQLVSREGDAVTGEIQVQTEAGRMIWPAHGDFGQRYPESSIRAVVCRADKPALSRGHQERHETPFGGQIHLRRLPTVAIEQGLPVGRAAELDAREAEHEHSVTGYPCVTRHRV